MTSALLDLSGDHAYFAVSEAFCCPSQSWILKVRLRDLTIAGQLKLPAERQPPNCDGHLPVLAFAADGDAYVGFGGIALTRGASCASTWPVSRRSARGSSSPRAGPAPRCGTQQASSPTSL